MNFEQLQEQENKLAEEKSKRGFMGQVVAEALLELEKYFRNLSSSVEKAVKGLNKPVQDVRLLNPVTEVSVKNFPKFPEAKETISVKEAKEIIQAINTVKDALKENKITIPEVKFPKSFEVSNLKEPKDQIRVTNLDELAKYLNKFSTEIVKAIKDSNKKTEIRMPSIAPRFEMKNEELLKAVQELKESFNIPETDLTGVVSSQDKTTEAIKSLRFPMPNFASSWQHSLDMQSKDLAKTITYIGTTEKIDYIEFTANDGYTYKKTFNYDEQGRNVGWTAWSKQE